MQGRSLSLVANQRKPSRFGDRYLLLPPCGCDVIGIACQPQKLDFGSSSLPTRTNKEGLAAWAASGLENRDDWETMGVRLLGLPPIDCVARKYGASLQRKRMQVQILSQSPSVPSRAGLDP